MSTPRTPQRARSSHDRAATEEALRAAALELLERQGVLAGLNLREVADEAGVNRGLVYQYFGSRRDLLRSALWAQGQESVQDAAAAVSEALPLRKRLSRFFWTSLRRPGPIRLMALLVLDGDERPRPLPQRAAEHRLLAAEAEQGGLPVDDPDALHATMASAVYGYVLLREHMAREIDVPVEELDGRVARCLDAMVTHRRRDEAPGPS
ncbi:TetR/AcrR family transcriptional regulator [Kitasatospora sp. NPDC051914]|uniref:TetR/AcrR family transcriptional regulator n=1 Tax=unclassified Kitasatospora TaxID=2633591 RepID=UPI00343EA623